jgi:hypothetical protein
VSAEIIGTDFPEKSSVSLRDRVLLMVWVFSYAIILWIFRVVKGIEDRMSARGHGRSRK